MMNIEELRKIFCEDGLYAVCVENGNIASHYRIVCLQKNGAALINYVDARVTDGFILRDGEFVTSLQALKEVLHQVLYLYHAVIQHVLLF